MQGLPEGEPCSGPTVARDNCTCIPWILGHMAVSSPCAEWPSGVHPHSRPP